MSENYYIIKLALKNSTSEADIQLNAKRCHSTGVLEFSLDEPQVDEILGPRSYSGADIPESVIEEVSETATAAEQGLSVYFANKLDAKNFLDYLDSEQVKNSGLIEEQVQDWNAKWRESYSPIKVSEDLEIVPSWEKSGSKGSLAIYPGMGFGTGSHETTFLCLKLFREILNLEKLKSCLDFGCGSGILGLATFLFCPEMEVDFYDIDQAALDNTVQNLELNNFENYKYKLLLPKDRLELNPKYNLVFANILKNVLEFESKFLVDSCHDGGYLILSGLLKGQEEDIIKLYQNLNPKLILLNNVQKGDWVCLMFQQGESL